MPEWPLQYIVARQRNLDFRLATNGTKNEQNQLLKINKRNSFGISMATLAMGGMVTYAER